MRLFLLALLLFPLAALAQAAATKPAPISFTLPSGKVLRFESEEQKWKFLSRLEHAQQVRLQNASHNVERETLKRVSIEGKVVEVVAEGVCVAVTSGKSVMVAGYPAPGKVAEGDACCFQVVDDGTVSSVVIQGARHQLAKYTYVSGQTAC